MAFISTPGAIGIIGGFAGIFAIIFIISCVYWRKKNPSWRRKARDKWVRERQEQVRQQRAANAEERRKISVAMRMNEQLRQSSRDGSGGSSNQRRDIESGLQIPPPARVETLPPYQRALDAPPVPPFVQPLDRVGSESSVPSYSSGQRRQTTGNDPTASR